MVLSITMFLVIHFDVFLPCSMCLAGCATLLSPPGYYYYLDDGRCSEDFAKQYGSHDKSGFRLDCPSYSQTREMLFIRACTLSATQNQDRLHS